MDCVGPFVWVFVGTLGPWGLYMSDKEAVECQYITFLSQYPSGKKPVTAQVRNQPPAPGLPWGFALQGVIKQEVGLIFGEIGDHWWINQTGKVGDHWINITGEVGGSLVK